MKSKIIDRVTVIWLAGALVVWTSCLVVLWGLAMDASGGSMLLTLAASFCSVSVAVTLPGRLVRGGDRLLRLFGFSGAVLPSAPRGEALESLIAGDARSTMRLLGVAAIVAAAGGALSTLAIFASGELTDVVTSSMLLSPKAWMIWKFSVQFVGMLPISFGISMVFLTAAIVRSRGGQDIYASVVRDWLWALAGGLTIFAAGWICGVNLLAMGVVAGVGAAMAAMVVFARRSATTRPLRVDRPIETPPVSRRIGIAAVFGVITGGLLLQIRIACDAGQIAGGWSAAWIAGSVAMLAGFLRWADRKSHAPGWRQRVGATIGTLAGLLLQGALGISAAVGGTRGWVCLAMAVCLQIPVAALTAVIVSRQRRMFASAGGRARSYVSSVAAGVGLAVIGYLVLLSLPAGAMWILAGSLGVSALAVVAGILPTDRPADQIKWAICGAMLLGAVTVAMLAGIRSARVMSETIRTGVWLSAMGAEDHPAQRVLPSMSTWRSQRIDTAMSQLIGRTGGKWLAGVACGGDLPDQLTEGVHVLVTMLDRSSTERGESLDEPYLLAGDSNLFSTGRLGREKYEGAFLSLLPADHPHAWRCYNRQTIGRFYRNVQRDGLAMMRIIAPGDSVGTALSAGRAFHETLGGGWLVFDAESNVADMLFIAKIGPGDVPVPVTELPVVPDRKLRYEWGGVKVIKLQVPGSDNPHRITVLQLTKRLGERR